MSIGSNLVTMMGLNNNKSREDEDQEDQGHLIFSTICMVGLSVEVQIKDGSLYSGIFHTLSFAQGDDGIVLKKARKIRKGKHEKSFTVGPLIDSFIISLADFVQVVVKDVQVSVQGESGDVSNDDVVAGSVEIQDSTIDLEREPERSTSCKTNFDPHDNLQEFEARRHDTEKAVELSLKPTVSVQESQVVEDKTQGKGIACSQVNQTVEAKIMVPEDQCLLHSNDETQSESRPEIGCGSRPIRPDDHAHANLAQAQTSSVSDHSTSVLDSRAPSVSPTVSKSNNSSSCNSSAKESKLNPGAKVFSPTFANPRHLSTVIPTNSGYISNIAPMLPTAAVEINSLPSHSSLTAKLAQYDSLVPGYSGLPAQYSRPVMGHANALQQPIRFTEQYHPVQAGPTYMHPSAHSVMVGRMGQIVYVHPVAQGPLIFSQGSPYPLCQPTMPKIQGTASPSLPLCMAPPPLVAVGNQPYATPVHIPFSQPIPSIRPIPVPGGNGFFNSKFR